MAIIMGPTNAGAGVLVIGRSQSSHAEALATARSWYNTDHIPQLGFVVCVINGIGGKTKTIGYVYLQVAINGQTINHKFYVFDTLPCKTHGILGQDFLSRYKSVINFNNYSLWCNDKHINLNLINSKGYFNLPARSKSILIPT